MWKRLAVLVVIALLPISAVAHTKLYYRKSYTSDYRKIEMISTPELTLAPIPIEIPTPTPSVEIVDSEDAVDTTDQITTPSDVDTPTIPTEVL